MNIKEINDDFCDIISKIKDIVGQDQVLVDEPMKKHTTFKVGGKAKAICQPKNIDEIVSLVKLFKEKNIPYYIIGNGSNMLVSDAGYNGVIIKLLDKFSDIEVINDKDDCLEIKAMAGAKMAVLGRKIISLSGVGFEFGVGIPGTIGGAIVMNAGAYGGEIKDFVKSVKVCDRDGNITTLSNSQLDFGYRHSIIPIKEYIVLEIVLEIKKGDKEEALKLVEELLERRISKQPLEYPSAGSTFKRPTGSYASKLIDEAGLRGLSVNGACVSTKHAGFLINKDGATASDIMELIKKVQKAVYENSNIMLEMEVKKLGFDK